MAKTPNYNATRPGGFTLLELIITIVIAGIVISIAVPNMQSLIQHNRQTAAINDFTGMVSYARGEAMARSRRINLCIANADRSGCADTGSNWSSGYLVMIDGTTKVLKVYDALPGDQSMTASGFSSTDKIQFGSNGAVLSTGSILFCDPRGNDSRRGLTINSGGQIRAADTATLGNCPS